MTEIKYFVGDTHREDGNIYVYDTEDLERDEIKVMSKFYANREDAEKVWADIQKTSPNVKPEPLTKDEMIEAMNNTGRLD